jgi:hypothetical protein
MRPFIGVTRSSDPDGQPLVNPVYVRALLAAGALPVPLPYVASAAEARELLARLQGVVFSGSEDLDPALWGEPRHPRTELMHPARMASELHYAREALAPAPARARRHRRRARSAGAQRPELRAAPRGQHRAGLAPRGPARHGAAGQQPPPPGRGAPRRRAARGGPRARRHRRGLGGAGGALPAGRAVAPRAAGRRGRQPRAVRGAGVGGTGRAGAAR